jgi:hypothetical protein
LREQQQGSQGERGQTRNQEQGSAERGAERGVGDLLDGRICPASAAPPATSPAAPSSALRTPTIGTLTRTGLHSATAAAMPDAPADVAKAGADQVHAHLPVTRRSAATI